jgi:prolyl-tRNA synthetase
MIGGLVMAHGDAKGLVLPPAIAPTQVVIIPIKADQELLAVVDELAVDLTKHHVRAQVDRRDTVTAGFKFNEWELKGVPVRIELGPKDVAKKSAVVVRRDDGSKIEVKLNGLGKEIHDLLATIQKDLLKQRRAELEQRTVAVENYAELKKAVAVGFASGAWCGSAKDEEKLKEETKATVRAIPFNQPATIGKCVVCGNPGVHQAVFGRSY